MNYVYFSRSVWYLENFYIVYTFTALLKSRRTKEDRSTPWCPFVEGEGFGTKGVDILPFPPLLIIIINYYYDYGDRPRNRLRLLYWVYLVNRITVRYQSWTMWKKKNDKTNNVLIIPVSSFSLRQFDFSTPFYNGFFVIDSTQISSPFERSPWSSLLVPVVSLVERVFRLPRWLLSCFPLPLHRPRTLGTRVPLFHAHNFI